MKKDLAKEIYDDGYVTGYKSAISKILEDLYPYRFMRLLGENDGMGLIIEKWENKLK